MASRRDLVKVLLFVGGAAVVTSRPWTWGRDADLAFRPLDGMAPFRILTSGAAEISGGGTAANVALIGISVPGQGPDGETLDRVRSQAAQLLLADWAPGTPVPITYFTDIQCPLCPGFEAQVRDVADAVGTVPDARELPLFPGSDVAARLVLAADMLGEGSGEAVRTALRPSRGMLPEPRLRRVLAEVSEVDVDALFTAADGAEVGARLAEDQALAHVLQIPGTPSAVIGRTVVVGRVPGLTLRAILEVEQAEGPPARA